MAGFPMTTPGFTPNPTVADDILKTKPKKLVANPNALQGEVTNPFGDDNDEPKAPSRKGQGKGRFGGNETAKVEPTPIPTPETTVNADDIKADKNGVVISKRPLKDFAVVALKDIDDKAVQLNNPFKVVIKGRLEANKDGVVILKNPKPVVTKGDPVNDPAIDELAKKAIVAVGDAGWFGYLKLFKAKDVIISLEQDGSKFIVNVTADQPSENEAQLASSGLNTLLGFAKSTAKADEKIFLEKTGTTFEGKNLVLKFEGDKNLVLEMIQRKLAEEKAKAGLMMENSSDPGRSGMLQANSNTAK
jgi:hypothetical protein